MVFITKEAEQRLGEMSLEELWNWYLQMKEEGLKLNKEEMKMIEFGTLDKPISIHWITNNWFKIYPNHNLVKIQFYGESNLFNFLEDIKKRESLLRRIILENIDNDTTESRI